MPQEPVRLALTCDDAPTVLASESSFGADPTRMDTIRDALREFDIPHCVAFVVGRVANGEERRLKGWLDAAGQQHERIYDVAVSNGRKIGPDGRCKTPVGSTVDVANATYSNTIGDAMLGAFWKDPSFDSGERAFYYVRVIEIPTPRWTAYDARFYGIKMAPEVPMLLQERAYTSPIWYTPGS